MIRRHTLGGRKMHAHRGSVRLGTLALGTLALGAAALGCAFATAALADPSRSVTAQDLCVTEGALTALEGARLSVEAPKMRAYLNRLTRPLIEARFTYLGATAHDVPLGSGAMRRQFGLKLRAQDACNLLYVMWHIEPESKLVVSEKTNPGEHTSAQCGNRGYRNIKPASVAPLPALRPGDSHALRAELAGEQMRVFIDDSPAWAGSVGPVGFDGPVGIRSDNARLKIELRVGSPLEGPAGQARACAASDAEGE
jgi:hypothetical protein